eukprot:1623541-Rhodomonas_salina.3
MSPSSPHADRFRLTASAGISNVPHVTGWHAGIGSKLQSPMHLVSSVPNDVPLKRDPGGHETVKLSPRAMYLPGFTISRCHGRPRTWRGMYWPQLNPTSAMTQASRDDGPTEREALSCTSGTAPSLTYPESQNTDITWLYRKVTKLKTTPGDPIGTELCAGVLKGSHRTGVQSLNSSHRDGDWAEHPSGSMALRGADGTQLPPPHPFSVPSRPPHRVPISHARIHSLTSHPSVYDV